MLSAKALDMLGQCQRNYVATTATAGVAASLLGVFAIRYLRRRRVRLLREARAAEAASRRQQTLEQLQREAEEEGEDTSLTSRNVEELLDDLRQGKLSAVQVIRAFTLKALKLSTPEVNCVTEPVPNALEVAQARDAQLAASESLGILHGLPVAIKENLNIQGMHSTCGVASKLGVRDSDCVIVRVLKAHGAVPFVKTNIPQTMMSYECSNPIYGVTTNPHDRTRGPGGSSGGDAALIALGGSLLGIGTDIAGSTRIPPAFCGVVGLKPTAGRISGVGVGTCMEGFSGVGKTAGPQSQTVAGCRLLMQALCSEEAWRLDSNVAPVPFDAAACTRKRQLRIGYYDDDGFFTPTPAYRRAVLEAKTSLERAGHELVPFRPPSIHRAMALYFSIVGADAGETLKGHVANDKVDIAIRYPIRLARLNYFLQMIYRFVGSLKWPQTASTWCQTKERSVAEFWQLCKQRQEYITEFTDLWKEKGLDGLICPPHVMGPPPLGWCGDILPSFSYTMLFNLLNYPAGIVPVTNVTAEDEAKLWSHPQSQAWDRTVVQLSIKTTGLPVAVQCVALPWQDEQCLYLMQELEDSLKAQRS